MTSNRSLLLTAFFIISTSFTVKAQYNNLWIPDTLSGTNFNLTIKDTFAQLRTGQQTITSAINNSRFWGPTLFVNKGETVHMNVTNRLNDSTTIHWHGMHLPAVMDGGPHQVIPPGTTWQPYWTINNQAGTYWYHPHLHEMTLEHLTKGIGGFLIVRDPQEAALALPRKYGIDDIPLVLTSRRYDASNQFVVQNTAYGDYLLTNGTPNAQLSLPKQYVRLRLLNAEVERGYDIGFSDNRTFYIIANDGGLLNAPVAVTRVKLLVGERVEIMVNLGGDAVGSTLDLKAFNSNQAFGFPGGEPSNNGQFGSLLNNIDFTLLHINVAANTNNPITSVPATLASNTYWTANDATVNRSLSITGGQPGTGQPFVFDNAGFNINTINKTINLNDIEKWTITNNNVFGHTFHIHDVQFKIVARNGSAAAVGSHESGWKDVMYVPRAENVTFVTKFDDYSDAVHPYMYHCHFSNHEDDGMMGQFVVTSAATTATVTSLSCANATFNATATVNTSYNGTATIPYTGGNAAGYNAGSAITSTGVTGLTAILNAGTLANGNGSITYSISGTPTTAGTASFAIGFGGQTCTLTLTVNSSVPNTPTVTGLNCAATTFSAQAIINQAYNGTASIPYTGGNGIAYAAGTPIASTGVTGMSATLRAGTLNNGAGNLIFDITGTPATSGTASFFINFGGRNCTMTLNINNTAPTTPQVSALLCDQATSSATIYANSYFEGTAALPYNGGNGVGYPANNSPIASTGVTGLIATVYSGTLANGAGNIVLKIKGTPAAAGIASFIINFGGQTCTLQLQVKEPLFDFNIIPNPAADRLNIIFPTSSMKPYYVWLYDAAGRTLLMLPRPDLSAGINIAGFPKGVYFVKVMENQSKAVIIKKFVKGN